MYKIVEIPFSEETQKRIQEYLDYLNEFCKGLKWTFESAVFSLTLWGLDHVQERVDSWKAERTSYGRVLSSTEAEAPAAEESAEQPQADSGG